jgi:tetraacyldisaccharide 4'-kinase
MALSALIWTKEKWSDFESFVEGVLYDRDLSISARLFGLFLHPFSFVFYVIIRIRVFLYSKGYFLHSIRLDGLVIVVGNLTMGGTGKTPVVERLARELQSMQKKVAVLSRGYKSKDEVATVSRLPWKRNAKDIGTKVVSDGKKVLLNSEEAGDEPFMLAKNLPGVVVLTDKDRVRAGQFAIREFSVEVLILDDGFQYLPIKADMNLLLVDQSNPFGNHKLLPRGILREPVSHLSRASYVMVTKSEIEPQLELLETIRKFNHQAEIIRCAHKPKVFRQINHTKQENLNYLHERQVGVFCGIASPRGFEQLIQRMSGELRYRKRFLDHHRYETGELERLFQLAKNTGVEVMITTEKDAVRIPKNFQPIIPLFFLRMEIEIVEGYEDFEEVVSSICKLKPNFKVSGVSN